MAVNEYMAAARFHAALRRFLHDCEELARDAGLTPRQYVLLLQIGAAGSTTVSELVERLALTQSTVTELVQRAVRGGLVTRTQSTEDARVVNLGLTHEGRERLERVVGRVEEPQRLRAVIEESA
jgi:DNA-binding MarR family transcriptional regulator